MKYLHIIIPQRVRYYCVRGIKKDRLLWGRVVLVSFYRKGTKHMEHVRNH
jgi:hypothetical protein